MVEEDHLLGVFQLEEEAFRVEARLGLSGWRTGWRLSWRKTRRVLPWRFFRGSCWQGAGCFVDEAAVALHFGMPDTFSFHSLRSTSL